MTATNLNEYYTGMGKTLPSLADRSKLYESNGLGSAASYGGTAAQNTALLGKLQTPAPAPFIGPVQTQTPMTQNSSPAPVPAWQSTLTDVLASHAANSNPGANPLTGNSPLAGNQTPYNPQTAGASYIAPPTTVPTPNQTPMTQNSSPAPIASPYIPVANPTKTQGPITTAQLTSASQLPETSTVITSTQTATGPSVAQTASAVAQSTNDSLTKEVETLRKQMEDITKKEEADAKALVTADRTKVNDLVGKTTSQDAYQAQLTKYDIQNKMNLYTEIQNKIVAAQEALNMGIIYEGDRYARMDLILGRQASLQKQGLAAIGALQGTAAVIKGSIDLGVSLANAAMDALAADDTRSINALNTLLTLDNNKLVTLDATEKTQATDRLAALTKQMEESKTNRNDILGYMTSYPEAFLKGGVTLLDTRESALMKMLPIMSANEKTKFNADIAAKMHAYSNTTDKEGAAADKTALLDAKSKGMTYGEAKIAFGDRVSIAYINSLYSDLKGTDVTPEQAAKDAAYAKYMNADGTLKTGFTSKIDPANGRAIIEPLPGYTMATDPSTGAVTATKDGEGGGFGAYLSNLWGAVIGK